MWINSSWMRPNAPIVGRKMRPPSARTIVGKKGHPLKNTVLSMPDPWSVFLGRTFSGHTHDDSMLKHELPPDLDWFRALEVWVDLGYQGIQSDDAGEMIEIPHKKPRKSKKNPAPALTAAQRAANKAVSQVRILLNMRSAG